MKTLIIATLAIPGFCFGQNLAMNSNSPGNARQEKEIYVFQNPANHFTRVEFMAEKNEKVTVDFLNATGTVIERIYKTADKRSEQFVELDTRYFSPGVYFVKVGEQMEKFVFY